MGVFTLKKGGHYARPFASWPWIGEQRMGRHVTFDASCQYDSAAYNAQDVNKLFGLSFGFSGVHHNSARFGWRWSKSDQCIELLAYVYRNGKRNQDEQLRFPVVAQVKPGASVILGIYYWTEANGPYGKTHFEFTASPNENTASKSVMVPASTDLPGYGLTHGLYFGGELVAPHEMSVHIDRP